MQPGTHRIVLHPIWPQRLSVLLVQRETEENGDGYARTNGIDSGLAAEVVPESEFDASSSVPQCHTGFRQNPSSESQLLGLRCFRT